jgi:hypothetical protein
MRKGKRPSTQAAKNDPEGAYAESKEIANFNKPGTFWTKYRKIIIKGVMIGGAVILGAVSAICMATGVLSPLGVIGTAAAAKLGVAAIGVGWATNIGIAMVGGGSLAWLGGKAQDLREAFKNRKKTFLAQLNAYLKKNKNQKTNVSKESGITDPATYDSKPSQKELAIGRQIIDDKKNVRLKDFIEQEIKDTVEDLNLDAQGNLPQLDYHFPTKKLSFCFKDPDRDNPEYIKSLCKTIIILNLREDLADQPKSLFTSITALDIDYIVKNLLDPALDVQLKAAHPDKFNVTQDTKPDYHP